MNVIKGLSPQDLRFVEEALDLTFPSGTTGLASYTHMGELAGAVVFTPQHKGNTNLHIAARKGYWFTPDFCTAMFSYAFVGMGALRITASIPHTNRKCVRLAERVGFRLEGFLRGFSFGDLIVYGMTRGECKWAA